MPLSPSSTVVPSYAHVLNSRLVAASFAVLAAAILVLALALNRERASSPSTLDVVVIVTDTTRLQFPAAPVAQHRDCVVVDGEDEGVPAAEKFLYGVPPNGPNNQYYGFVTYVKLAAMLNRTLVLPAFAAHWTLAKAVGGFTTFPFNSTFDVSSLARLPGAPRMIALDDYARAHGRRGGRFVSADAMWVTDRRDQRDPESDVSWSFHRDRFFGGCYAERHFFPAGIPDTQARLDWTLSGVNATFGGDDPSWRLLVVNHGLHNDINYLVLRASLGHRGLPFRDAHLRVIRALAHAAAVLRKAEDFIASSMGARPFFAVHWRRADREDAGNCTTRLLCVDAVDAGDLISVIDSMVFAALSAGHADAREWPLFVAAVRFSAADSDLFAQRGYKNVVRYTDVEDDDDDPGAPYYGSLAEQEICMRATGFVGTYSTWSERVIEMRVASLEHHLTWHVPSALRGAVQGVDGHREPWAGQQIALNASHACGFEYMGISDEPPRVMTLACAAGAVVSRVVFASFGWPWGFCGTFVENRMCHCSSSAEHVAALCVGRSRCDIPVHNGPEHFACACEENGYALAVLLECT
eukprot:Opistho-1_new@49335